MSNRVVTIGGGALLAGVGYYFYQAGGDPKVAQKKAEADAAKLSHEVKDHLPGSGKQAKKDAEVAGSEISSKVNQLTRDAKNEASKVDDKLEQYRKDAAASLDKTGKEVRKEANQAIDTFDKKVTEGAAQAKSGISSWFGGSK
ncbi:hypothetical protein DOTSEDRAFT_70624 [Dothistroma septosporum NZE10]|uniref:Calcofluor white hypersensitive protein n=1 Tax=Dothistroma septosporum (strain NZE10 / CBS 128990) TaxID=675120 RepID=N1PT84_DOTSN|nr:hypothetical protein DOTSEDRAFT_70624 [Dothistroma septosporum NZE10]